METRHIITGWEIVGHESHDIYTLTLTSENGEVVRGVNFDDVVRLPREADPD